MDKKRFGESFKISLELEGEKRISGNNLFKLLDKIMVHGSISSAASRLGFSYRYAWGLIKEAENAMGLQLVEKYVGGYAGGGTILTREGKKLLFQYKSFKEEVDKQLNDFTYKADTSLKKQSLNQSIELENGERHLLLASTKEPVETGLLDIIENAFYQSSNILVRHIAVGSGRALDIAREGRVDLVLTHAPELEEQFMEEGWGFVKTPLMANDFVVVGPSTDPAKVSSIVEDGVIEVFKGIAISRSNFISRGDQSGTHLREQEIWKAAGISPGGSWYHIFPGVAGNLGTLSLAAEKEAYTFVDKASYLLAHNNSNTTIYTGRDNNIKDRELLKNIFVLILINQNRVPAVNHQDSLLFSRWLQQEGEKIIAGFGKEKFGEPLFYAVEENAE